MGGCNSSRFKGCLAAKRHPHLDCVSYPLWLCKQSISCEYHMSHALRKMLTTCHHISQVTAAAKWSIKFQIIKLQMHAGGFPAL